MTFPFDKDILLENNFVLLRPLQLLDIDNLLEVAAADKNLLQFSPMPIYSRDLLTKFIEKSLDGRLNKNRYSFSIFDKHKKKYAGSTAFLNISDADKRLEIGSTWIGKEFQGTGLNRNAKYLLLNFAFSNLKVERVEFKTDERNAASRKAIEKIGGRFEGILRSHTLMYDGFRRNSVYYSILKGEWEKLKENFI